jgi:hypothetical protein
VVPGFASSVISISSAKGILCSIADKIFAIDRSEKRLGVPPPKKID